MPHRCARLPSSRPRIAAAIAWCLRLTRSRVPSWRYSRPWSEGQPAMRAQWATSKSNGRLLVAPAGDWRPSSVRLHVQRMWGGGAALYWFREYVLLSPSNTSTAAKPSHTYNAPAAKHTASLTVRDGRGGSNNATVVIDAGNTQPQPSISSPTSTALFSVGQHVPPLSRSATDQEDGALPDTALSWTVLLHHDTHTHPFITNQVGNNIALTTPQPEDLRRGDKQLSGNQADRNR